jgi:hypothetical protein
MRCLQLKHYLPIEISTNFQPTWIYSSNVCSQSVYHVYVRMSWPKLIPKAARCRYQDSCTMANTAVWRRTTNRSHCHLTTCCSSWHQKRKSSSENCHPYFFDLAEISPFISFSVCSLWHVNLSTCRRSTRVAVRSLTTEFFLSHFPCRQRKYDKLRIGVEWRRKRRNENRVLEAHQMRMLTESVNRIRHVDGSPIQQSKAMEASCLPFGARRSRTTCAPLRHATDWQDRTDGLDRTGPDWTGLDSTGLDWTGLDWTGLDCMDSVVRHLRGRNSIRFALK